MKLLMTSRRDDKINLLYSCLNDIGSFFYDNSKTIFDIITKRYV